MTTTYYQYRLYCQTENTYVNWILNSTDPQPTTCPNNSSHAVDSVVTIVNTINQQLVSIKEEDVITGGHFASNSMKIVASPNSTTSVTKKWNIPVTVLLVEFATIDVHNGDVINMHTYPILGGIVTANISAATAYDNSTTYTIDSMVTYNGNVYSCIQTSTGNLPTNKSYWKFGCVVYVSSTIITNCKVGYYIRINTITDPFSMVVSIDKNNNKIYLESHPGTYSMGNYIYVFVYFLKDYEIGFACLNTIGKSKIGGASIPTDVTIVTEYTNNSDVSKTIIGRIEYLY